MSEQYSKHPVQEEYARLASKYESKWSFYIQATARETLARIELRPKQRLLDVGCGTGVLLQQLSEAYPEARLYGVDAAPEMLEIAHKKIPPSIELYQGWAEHLPFDTGQFDLVVSCNMFHYSHQPMAALREMKRVLRASGRLILTDWCDDYLACRVCDIYLRIFNRAHFKAYGLRECARLLDAAEYVNIAIERYKINWLWGLMTARATKPGLFAHSNQNS